MSVRRSEVVKEEVLVQNPEKGNRITLELGSSSKHASFWVVTECLLLQAHSTCMLYREVYSIRGIFPTVPWIEKGIRKSSTAAWISVSISF